MRTRFLGALGVALAIVCWVALILLRRFGFGLPISAADVAIELALVAAGSAVFWRVIARTLERRAAEVRRRTQHLEALHEASMALATEHELRAILQKVVDLSRKLSRARYGALGLLDHDGLQIEQFITSGIPPETQARIGSPPIGKGILGQSLFHGRALRVPHISRDARAAGYPPNHPHMESFLGVPIMSKGRVFGNLYVADKLPESAGDEASASSPPIEFSQEDQEILEMFAAQVAIAIENAQLHRQNRQIAVLHERERIGMDLHDGVIQSIYAIGLMLDDTQHRLDADPALARERLSHAITGLNGVIRDIRAYIHDLHSRQLRGRDLAQGIEELVRDLESYSMLSVLVDIDSEKAAAVTPQQSSELLHIVQEALINVRKHAHASTVRINLHETGNRLQLTIEDDGIGFRHDPAGIQTGHGLRNMAERTQNLGGVLETDSKPGHGTRITVSLPLPPVERA